jgi:hypothetical protein
MEGMSCDGISVVGVDKVLAKLAEFAGCKNEFATASRGCGGILEFLYDIIDMASKASNGDRKEGAKLKRY